MTDANELADRYVAMWTEPDAERRRFAIAERWTEDAVHILDPPQEAREAAAALDITHVPGPRPPRAGRKDDPRVRGVRRARGVHLQAP
jgi:hypothetical protein